LINKKELEEDMIQKVTESILVCIKYEVIPQHVCNSKRQICNIVYNQCKSYMDSSPLTINQKLAIFASDYYKLLEFVNQQRKWLCKVLGVHQNLTLEKCILKVCELIEDKQYYKKRYEELIKEKVRGRKNGNKN